jgi:hypothetical protein
MRKGFAIFSGAIAVAALVAGPVRARTSDGPKPESKQDSPACSVYQRLPDGTWAQAPCEEINSAAPAGQKASTRGPGKASR